MIRMFRKSSDKIEELTREYEKLEDSRNYLVLKIIEHTAESKSVLDESIDRLKEVLKAQNRLIINITYEFKTPLTLIIGLVKNLIKDSNDSKSIGELMVIHRNAIRLINLINQFLDILEIESGEIRKKIDHVSGTDIPLENSEPEIEIKNSNPNSFFNIGPSSVLPDTDSIKPVLLVVEDNSDVRNYIKDFLTIHYKILEAIDGEDGWNKSTQNLPDLIISGIIIPGMDGLKLCRKLKSDERTSHIPVIFLTIKDASEDKIEGLETGADDYITKPFEPRELKARIKNLIEQRKRIHEHFRKHGFSALEYNSFTLLDQMFLQKIVSVINTNISDSSFGVENIAEKMTISRSLLLKKITALIGEPPVKLLRRTRLNKAAELIERKFGSIYEIALEVGFTNPSYFAVCFKKQFGCSPSQYLLSKPFYL